MNNSDSQANKQRRTVRSFVRRAGRMSPGQQRALDKLWAEYGIDLDLGHVDSHSSASNNLESQQLDPHCLVSHDLQSHNLDSDGSDSQNRNSHHLDPPNKLDLNALFHRNAPCVLEIGFGMGHSLFAQAIHNPDINYIGIEVHQPGVGSLLAALAKHHLTNVRIISADAVGVLQQSIADNSFDKVQIFFPDPWPKLRHQKRRLVQAPFVQLLLSKLKEGGYLHLATDWEDYAQQMLAVLKENAGLQNIVQNDFSLNHPLENRPLTKFEMRGKKLGHNVWDLLFIKV